MKKLVWSMAFILALFAPLWAGGNSQSAASSGPPVVTGMFSTQTMPNANASVLQELNKRTGTDFQITWVTEADYPSRINATIASGNLPDIFMFDTDLGMELVNNGALLQLNDLLTKFGPNILADKKNELNKGLNGNGKIWGIIDSYTSIPVTTAIRKDWTKNVGAQVPTANVSTMKISDFVNLMRLFTKNNPNKNGVADTFGFCFAMAGLDQMIAPIFWAFDVPATGWWLDNGNIRSWLKHPNFLKGMEVLRTMYREGLMDRDFITVPDATTEFQKLWNGTVGAASWWHAGVTNNWISRYVEGLQPNDFYYVNLIADDGTGGGYYSSMPTDYVGITSKCKNPEAAMKLMDYLYTDEGQALAYIGIEGKHYEWTDKADYRFKYLEPYASNIALQRADGGFILANRIRTGLRNALQVKTWTPITTEMLMYSYDHPNKSGVYVYGVPAILPQIGTTLNDIVKELFATLITSEGNITTQYQSYISRWEAAGGKTLEEQATAIYKSENR